MEYIFRDINEAWTVLFDDLGNNQSEHQIKDFFQSSPRGRLCNETIGLSIKILEPQQCLVWNKIRKLSPIYLAKEYLWYLKGSRTVEDAPSSVWNKLANTKDPDKGLVNSNYGAYIFTQPDNKNPEKTVWDATIELLKRDSDSRQALIQIPIMSHRQDKDTPCTSSAHFILREGKLYLTMYMRSCDAWFGAANDWSQFIFWQLMMAKELDVELGWFRYVAGSYHVYEENFITDFDKYKEAMDDTFIKGKEEINYWKFYDDRNYRIIWNEITEDFKTLTENSRKDMLENNLLKNEQLKYMLANMEVSTFKN